MKQKLAIIELDELTDAIREIIREENKLIGMRKCYSINEIAIMLHLAHGTVKKMVNNGDIGSTVDGHITEFHLNEYLRHK